MPVKKGLYARCWKDTIGSFPSVSCTVYARLYLPNPEQRAVSFSGRPRNVIYGCNATHSLLVMCLCHFCYQNRATSTKCYCVNTSFSAVSLVPGTAPGVPIFPEAMWCEKSSFQGCGSSILAMIKTRLRYSPSHGLHISNSFQGTQYLAQRSKHDGLRGSIINALGFNVLREANWPLTDRLLGLFTQSLNSRFSSMRGSRRRAKMPTTRQRTHSGLS